MSGPHSPALEPLLVVERLMTHLPTPRGLVRAVDGVSFTLAPGKTLAVVGESGSGKSMLCRTLMGLAPASAMISRSSKVLFRQNNLIGLKEKEFNRIRSRHMAMIFQDPMTALNPVLKIGRQITETLKCHLGLKKKPARDRAHDLMQSVGISNPGLRFHQYPHQLSGGMQQRVAIAMALSCGPELLIADEPTTALDVTVQAEILDLLARLRNEMNMALILVTHDLGVAASRADDIAVMYAGRFVEQAPAVDLFRRARMPYTRMLIQAIPRLSNPPHTRLPVINGRPPDLIDPPPGCRFAPRCPQAASRCFDGQPGLTADPFSNHWYACFHPWTDPGQECFQGAGR